jgi:hypothetical protein
MGAKPLDIHPAALEELRISAGLGFLLKGFPFAIIYRETEISIQYWPSPMVTATRLSEGAPVTPR